jgi:hypothetical protein
MKKGPTNESSAATPQLRASNGSVGHNEERPAAEAKGSYLRHVQLQLPQRLNRHFRAMSLCKAASIGLGAMPQSRSSVLSSGER